MRSRRGVAASDARERKPPRRDACAEPDAHRDTHADAEPGSGPAEGRDSTGSVPYADAEPVSDTNAYANAVPDAPRHDATPGIPVTFGVPIAVRHAIGTGIALPICNTVSSPNPQTVLTEQVKSAEGLRNTRALFLLF